MIEAPEDKLRYESCNAPASNQSNLYAHHRKVIKKALKNGGKDSTGKHDITKLQEEQAERTEKRGGKKRKRESDEE